jgi:cation transport ATPase
MSGLEMTDLEMNQWREQWLAQPSAPTKPLSEIRNAAIRQQRRLRASHIGALLTAAALLVFGGVMASKNPSLESWLWAAAVWSTTLAATAFSIWNWQGLWKANVQSVADFERDYETRCLASLRAVRVGMAFLVVQTAIAFPWLAWDYLTGQLAGSRFAGASALLACLVAVFTLHFRRYRRRAQRELEQLRATRLENRIIPG